MANNQKLIDRIFRDKEGKVVVWQTPNPPLILWAMSLLVAKLSDGTIHNLFHTLSFGFIFTWAWLEAFYGASYFRRLLGATVLVISVLSKIK